MLFIIKCIHIYEASNTTRIWMALSEKVSKDCLLNLLKLQSFHNIKETFIVGLDRKLESIDQLKGRRYPPAGACEQVL